MTLLRAHQALLQAELAELGGHIRRIAAEAGCLVALALYALLLLTIGGTLFLGEWLFGSIGWSIILAVLASVAGGVTLGAAIVEAPPRTMGRAAVAGAVTGVLVALILAANLPSRICQAVADRLVAGGVNLDAAWAPAIVGLVALGILLGVVGLLVGARIEHGVVGAIVGIICGALLGGLLGGLTFSRHGGVALGIAVGVLTYPIVAVVALTQAEFDPTARFRRLWPNESYEAALATKAWFEQRWEELARSGSDKP
ncbi:MAG: hypothetical protein ACHQZR_06305 [Candidatus Limnocylindrales bacterium]